MSTPAEFDSGKAARAAAERCLSELAFTPPGWVSFDASQGRVLITGPVSAVNEIVPGLDPRLRCVVLYEDDGADPITASPCEMHWACARTPPRISGYLGDFHVSAGGDPASMLGGDSPAFDVVLDLHAAPLLAAQEKPVIGYLASHDDRALARDLAARLPEWVGVFDKPRYFRYRPDLCAHARRGLPGCSACLQSCATQALRADGDGIAVDPYLCQGCGSCAAVCPSGAIEYAVPPIGEWLNRARQALSAYRDAGGDPPRVLLHDEASGDRLHSDLPPDALPMAVEEVGAWGMEAWLALLAYGARQVILVTAPDIPAAELAATQRQIAVAQAVLAGAGHARDRIMLVEPDANWPDAIADAPAIPAHSVRSTFAALGRKRDILALALQDLLPDDHTASSGPVELPVDAPFGCINVDRQACTLCMACVSVCPSAAVTGGGTEPKLLFRESNCLQCGLCKAACPENAITLQPRLDYEAFLHPKEIVLNEEAMAHCVSCGRPFAPQKLVQRMRDKLAGHWMYQNERAQRRLSMCEDCRTRDIFSDEAAMHPYRQDDKI